MKRVTVIVWGLLILLLPAILLQAQENKVYSLTDCIQMALKNNSQLRNSHTEVDIAKTNVVEARSALLPSLSTSLSAGRWIQGDVKRVGDVPRVDSLTGQIIYEQREYIQAKTERNSYSANANLNQLLWDWGRSWASLKQAGLGKQSAEFTLITIKNSVVFDVKQKYYELLKAKELEDVYQQAVKASEEQLKRTEVMQQIGSVALTDVYKARVKLGTDQSNFITQQNLVIKAKADLNNSLGVDPELPIDIEGMEPIDVSGKYTLANAMDVSLQKNPELRTYELNINSYGYGKHQARTAFLPAFYGGVSYSRSNEQFGRVLNKQLDRDYTMTIGMQMDLNIFNGFADKAKLDRQTLNYKKAEETLVEQKRLLKAQATQAFLNLKANKEIAEINRMNLASAEEDLRLATESYKIGAGTLLEVIDAQLAVTRAKSILISAQYDTQVALAYLEMTMGIIQE
jgi:outer membrane protein